MAVWDSRQYGSDSGWDYERHQPWSVTMQQKQHQAMLEQQAYITGTYLCTPTVGAISSAVIHPEPNKKLLLLK